MSTRPRSEDSGSPRATKKAKVEEKTETLTGVVNTFQPKRGYGFITPDAGGADVFVHQSQIHAADDGYRVLRVGQKVEYTAVCENNKWKATKVTEVGGGPIATQGGNKGGRAKVEAKADVKLTSDELNSRVTTQIEYYLSDKNLTRDLWMRAFIIANGAVSVANLLKCNKLKALTTDLSVIETAVNGSSQVHMTTVPVEGKDGETEVAVARGADADNVPALPSYTPPTTLLLADLPTGYTNWKDIRAGFLANYSASVFVYLAVETPFLVVSAENKAAVAPAVAGGIKSIDGAQICGVQEVTDEKQSEALLKQHYAALAKQSSGKRDKRSKKAAKPVKPAPREGPVSVGGDAFECEQDVYDKVRGIMKQYKNSAPLMGDDKKFMMTLFKAHPRAAEKLKFARNVIVKDNEKFAGQSRCFYVVNKDNKEEDISYVKCIRNL